MANLIPMGRSAWFSLSVPKSKVESWVASNGRVEPDPFQADLLFAENSEAADVQRIFKSKEFLAGHVTVFHSELITRAARQEVASNMDLMKFMLLPWKELDEIGITFIQCLRDNRTVSKTHHQSSDRSEQSSTSNQIRISTLKKSENQTISKKYVTQDEDEVQRNTRIWVERTSQQSTGGGSSDNCEFSPTPDITFVADTSQTKKINGDNRNCGTFCHSLNFDITHLDDVTIPHVRLMDFNLGINGCEAEKKITMLGEKHTS